MLEKAKSIMKILEDNGYQAFLVGGCVRDKVLGIEPKDYDIATNAIPSKVIELMEANGMKSIPTGIEYGTVTVISDLLKFEITTYREDGRYSNRRHPDHVTYAKTILEDLSRRDFTINSMAMDLHGTIVDPFGGLSDLKKKNIRCVGKPTDRFREDPLRILRGIRFAAKYDLSIDYTTRIAMGNCSPLLSMVSQERIFSEFKNILMYGKKNIQTMRRCNVLHMIIPELYPTYDFEQNNPHHHLDLMKHIDRVIDGVDTETLKLAALFHDIGKPACRSYNGGSAAHYYKHEAVGEDIARAVLSRLKASNEEIEKISLLVKYHGSTLTDKTIKRMAGKYGRSFVEDLLKLQISDKLSQVIEEDKIKQLRNNMTRLDEILIEPHDLKTLAINGYDLIHIGIEEGPKIGSILENLLEIVLERPELNEKEVLINMINTQKMPDEAQRRVTI